MPRPVKSRKVCHYPQTLEFYPAHEPEKKPAVIMTVDEYEVIRLIDKEGMSQEQCSERMRIARTTVQRIYEIARKKLADALVEGRTLRIEGGDICLCDGQNTGCGHRECYKQTYHQQYQKPKGEHVVRAAVPWKEEQVFPHFGKTEQFKIYDIVDGTVVSSELVNTSEGGPVALTGVLGALKVDILICGGIGDNARAAVAAAGIRLHSGVAGAADEAVDAFLGGMDFIQ